MASNDVRRLLLKTAGLLVPAVSAAAFAPAPGMNRQAPLRIAFGDATPPLYWKTREDSTHDVEGMCVDLMAELARLLDARFEASVYPLPRVQTLVEVGAVDGMVNVLTPERLAYSIATRQALFQDRISIFVHRDSPYLKRLQAVRTLDDLARTGVTVLSLIGAGWTRRNLESRGMKVYFGTGTGGEVKMLIGRRGDVVVDMSTNVNWWLKKLPGSENIVELPGKLDMIKWYLLIGKRSPFAQRMPELEQALQHLQASPRYKAILNKHGLNGGRMAPA
ncbi:MAG: transporter substrate-binding domain-containing protein [Pseudomonadota bacterium]